MVKRILVVERNQKDMQTIEQCLNKMGEVVGVADYCEATEAVGAGRPDLLVVDASDPHDEYDNVWLIRAVNEGKDTGDRIPAILILTTKDISERCLFTEPPAPGIYWYMESPVDSEELAGIALFILSIIATPIDK